MGFSGGLARLVRYTEGLACASLYGVARPKGPRSYRGILRWVTSNGFPSRPRAEWSPEGSVLPREGRTVFACNLRRRSPTWLAHNPSPLTDALV